VVLAPTAATESPDETRGRRGARRPFPWLALVLVCGTGAIGSWLYLLYRGWDFDDAFIVYRYVENLRAGHGWAFNAGEQWNASTSVLNPLLILAASYAVGGVPKAAHLVGVAALGVGVVALGLTLLRSGRALPALALPATAMLVPPLLLTWGLETQLFLGLILLFVALEMQGRNTWLLAGLLSLVRPDGVLFVVFKSARELVEHRRVPWRGLAVVSAVVSPWVVYSLVTFDTVLPATLGNKRGQGASGGWGEGLVYLRGLQEALVTTFTGPAVVVLIAAFAGLGLVATLARRQWALASLGLFALVQQVAYAVLNPPYYHWYGVVFLVALCFYALLALDGFLRLLGPPLRPYATTAVLALILLGVGQHWMPRTEARLGPREVAYQRVARYIRTEIPEARTVSAAEAGVLGYYLPLQVSLVDLIGLTSDNPPYYDGRALDAFFAPGPELALFHQVSPDGVWGFEIPVFTDRRFSERYELQQKFHTEGYPDLTLYRRRSP
jgi:arabinofuranosyltransferase